MSVSLSNLSGNVISLFGASQASASGSLTNITSLLLASYDGSAGSVQRPTMQNPVVALQIAERNKSRDIQMEAQTPTVQRDIAIFAKAVQNAKTVKQLLANPTALKVLLTANGLGSEAGFPALAQKALMSNPTDPNGLANQLSSTNGQWLVTAETYQFATKGLAIIQNPKAISTITNGYAEVLWRQSLDRQTPGLSDALYFLQNAKNFNNANQILGDPIMRSVVTTALGLPPQIAYQSLNAQDQAITRRLHIANFQDPHFVQSFADRFLAVKQVTSQGAGGMSSGLIALASQAQSLTA